MDKGVGLPERVIINDINMNKHARVFLKARA